MKKLKPCPFCSRKRIRTACDLDGFFCVCMWCFAKGPGAEESEANAIKEWNRRAPLKTKKKKRAKGLVAWGHK